MNKKIITILVAATMIASTAFATGASEDTIVFNAANSMADSSSTYVAGTHDLVCQSLDVNGNVVSESSQTVTVSKKTADGWYFNEYAQGSDIMSLVASVYDGFAFTPFEDGIDSDFIDYELKGQETVDGKTCNVLAIDYAIDPALLAYKAHFSGSEDMIGYDFDDDDYDGSVSAIAYVDSETSALVKLVLNWDINGQSIVQTNSYTAEGDASVPSQIAFEVTDSQYSNGIVKESSYKIVDTLSDYTEVGQFTRTRS